MADYYLEFSQVIAHLTSEEFDWLRQQLEIVHVFGPQEFTAHELPDHPNTAQADWSGYRFYRDWQDEMPDPEEAGFRFHFEDADDPEFGRHLWLYADDYGDVCPLAELVQKFLRRFRPRDCWSLTYASSCSKRRLGSFGGGAVFVTADEIKFDSSWDFVDRETAAFDRHLADQSQAI